MRDCCLTSTQNFQLYHGENKIIFNEMMMRPCPLCNSTRPTHLIVFLSKQNNNKIKKI